MSDSLLFPEFGTAPVDRFQHLLREDPSLSSSERDKVRFRLPFRLTSKWHTTWWLACVLYNVKLAFGNESANYLYFYLKGDEHLKEYLEQLDDDHMAKSIAQNCKRVIGVLLDDEYIHNNLKVNADVGDSLTAFREVITQAAKLRSVEFAKFILTVRNQSNAITSGLLACKLHERHTLFSFTKLEDAWSWFYLVSADLKPNEIGRIIGACFEDRGMKTFDTLPLFLEYHGKSKFPIPLTREEAPDDFLDSTPSGTFYVEGVDSKKPPIVCHHCKKPGHIRPKCPDLQKKQSRKKGAGKGNESSAKRQKPNSAIPSSANSAKTSNETASRSKGTN